jgi:hypothetical protein
VFLNLCIAIIVYLMVAVCKEALEVLTVALVLNPKTLESLTKDKMWHTFIIDLLLLCKNRYDTIFKWNFYKQESVCLLGHLHNMAEPTVYSLGCDISSI